MRAGRIHKSLDLVKWAEPKHTLFTRTDASHCTGCIYMCVCVRVYLGVCVLVGEVGCCVGGESPF